MANPTTHGRHATARPRPPQQEPTPTPHDPTSPSEDELRRVAIRRVKKKRDFRRHLFVYLVLNIVFWACWLIEGAVNQLDFPWPIFPTVIWGVFVLGHASDLYWRNPLREELVQREIERLRTASRVHPLDTYDFDDDDD
jgi:hypothetical protein